MGRRRLGGGRDPQPQKQDTPVVVLHDPVSEAVVIGSCAQDRATFKKVQRKLRSDHFLVRDHADAWIGMIDLENKGLEFDLEAIERFAGSRVATTLKTIIDLRPGVAKNLDWHIENILWDKIRAEASKGVVAHLVQGLRDPTMDRQELRALARKVGTSLEGGVDREMILDPTELVRSNMKNFESRLHGSEVFAYGIEGFDFDENERIRLVAGMHPGMVTLITSLSGAGKTTTAANLAIAQWRLQRRVLYGAWEIMGGPTLEVLAGISLGYHRTDVMAPRYAPPDSPVKTREGRIALEERQHDLSKYIRFVNNPFLHTKGKNVNDRNLDIIHQLIADSGCHVFIGDLWERCLASEDGVRFSEAEERRCLFKQQAIFQETHTHGVLLQQQRLKEVEQRPDKRPTREGVKGSSAYIDVADTIVGVHRPALFKTVTDNRLELLILKQRWGPWPLAVEVDFEPTTGQMSNGRTIAYVRAGEASEMDSNLGGFLAGRGSKKRFS